MKKNFKKTKPFPFQGIGIYRMTNRFGGRSLNADDVGLGKTIQGLYASLPFRHKRPMLAVVPSAVKLGWEEQVREHTKLKPYLLYGRKPPKHLPKADIYIINWEILQYWVKRIKELNPSVIIGDEIHYCKTPGSKRTKAFIQVCDGIKTLYFLSGTPIENGPAEFFVPLHILRPDLFPEYRKFAYRYSIPKFTHWGVKFSGSRNGKELNQLLKKSCFPYSTKIFTEKGPIEIGEIVENEIPIKVLSQDTKTSKISWQSISAYSVRQKTDKLIKIKHQFGELICTPDHLIWTQDGWKRSEACIPGDYLSTLPKQKTSSIK